MSFGLQSLFFWAVFLQRKTLADSLIGIATGPKAPGRDASLKLFSVYAGGRIAGKLARPLRRGARSAGGRADRLIGGVAGSGGKVTARQRAPLFGAGHSAPVGGAPPVDGPAAAERRRAPVASSSGEGAAKDPGAKASASPPPEGAATARGTGRHKRPSAEERVATGRKPREEKAGKEHRAGARPAQGEGRQETGKRGAGQPPLRKPASAGEGKAGLGEELRAEAERGREVASKQPPASEPKSAGRPSPPRRRRWRRKGGDGR
jgi:hypothetical protein